MWVRRLMTGVEVTKEGDGAGPAIKEREEPAIPRIGAELELLGLMALDDHHVPVAFGEPAERFPSGPGLIGVDVDVVKVCRTGFDGHHEATWSAELSDVPQAPRGGGARVVGHLEAYLDAVGPVNGNRARHLDARLAADRADEADSDGPVLLQFSEAVLARIQVEEWKLVGPPGLRSEPGLVTSVVLPATFPFECGDVQGVVEFRNFRDELRILI